MLPSFPAFRCVRRSLLAASFCVLLAAPGAAQETPELVTDRPDQSESAVTVPRGYVQLELGALFLQDEEDGFEVEAWEVPGTLVRIGLSKRIELRVVWSGYVSGETELELLDTEIEEEFDGIADAQLGFKVRLLSGGAVDVALLVAGTVPVGDDELTTDEVDPSFRFAFGQSLSERVSLGYNVGMEWESAPGDDAEVHTLGSFIYTLVLGFGLSDRVGVFTEVFGSSPASAAGGDVLSFDTGLTFLVRDNLQLDLAGGFGLNDEAADSFFGFGVSIRLPR